MPVPPLSMLRIKSENGEQAFLLMMRPEDTIGDVRNLLAKTRWVRGRAGGCRASLAPRPNLMCSDEHPGTWIQPPLRSSAPFHPRSTRMMHSPCRPQAWFPMPHCCCGLQEPCRQTPALVLALPPTLAQAHVPE